MFWRFALLLWLLIGIQPVVAQQSHYDAALELIQETVAHNSTELNLTVN